MPEYAAGKYIVIYHFGSKSMELLAKFRSLPRLQEPADQASDHTLNLHLDNLELRFLTIDEAILSTPKEQQTYDDIKGTFAGRRRPLDIGAVTPPLDIGAVTRPPTLTWDDAFRLESKIGLLLPDDRLRYEIAARLRW